MTDSTKNVEVQIRAATKEDMKEVAEMIQELADFEKMSDGPKLTVKDLERDGFESSPPAFRSLVAARAGGGLAGFALFFPTYSTWQGRALMLEDLYVRQALRGAGIGKKLFNAVAKEAFTTGCSRLDFHVLEWNPARGFYERKGAVNLTSTEAWCYYRLSGEALRAAGDAADD